MLAAHRDGLSSSSFLAWSSIAQSACQQAFSLLVNRYLRPWVRILPSAEGDNLSPFDSNIACLCQSIEINNNKHVCMYVLHDFSQTQNFVMFNYPVFSVQIVMVFKDWTRPYLSETSGNNSLVDFLCFSLATLKINRHALLPTCPSITR